MRNQRPRVGLNLLYLRPGCIGGGETYARGLIQGFIQIRPQLDLVLFLNRAAWPTFDWIESVSGFERVLCRVPLRPSLRHIYEQTNFAGLCRQHRIDLLHSLGNVTPLATPCPRVVTIHDLLYRGSPGRVRTTYRLFTKAMVPLSARRSSAVLTVSYYSRKDVLEFLRVPPEKVFVTLEGPGQDWGEPVEWAVVRAKYKLPERYFLAVGTASHKRLDVSMEAVRAVRSKGTDAHLVVVGHGNSARKLGNNGDCASFLGHVAAEELSTLYRNAVALVCSSEVEGFGLPILEAMATGTPVIATDRGALVEVVGAGGLLVECGNANSLAEMMWMLLQNPLLGEHLRDHGRDHVRGFSWETCATRTLEAYEAVLNSCFRASGRVGESGGEAS